MIFKILKHVSGEIFMLDLVQVRLSRGCKNGRILRGGVHLPRDRFAPPLRIFAPPLKNHALPLGLGKVSMIDQIENLTFFGLLRVYTSFVRKFCL